MKEKILQDLSSILFYCLIAFVSTAPVQVHGQLASWSLAGSMAGTGGPGITAHSVTLGSGLSSDYGNHCGTCMSGNLRVWGWANPAASPGSIAAAVTHNKYIEFAFTVNAGAQAVTVTAFNYTVKAGFTSNCTGTGPYNSVRYRIDNGATPGSLIWMGNKGSACGAENTSPTLNGANNGSCVNIARNISNSSANDASCLSNTFPITVNPGQTIRFRIYIGTSNSSTWRTIFGDVSIAGTNPLPVNLSAFNLNCENSSVKVNWSTTSEQNSDRFIVEKSRDMNHWIEVATVQASGNSNIPMHYSVTDQQPFDGVAYYRLIQKDFDGAEKIYDPGSISCLDIGNSMIVFPNPTKEDFTIEIQSSENRNGSEVILLDVTGKIVSVRTFDIVKGKNQFLINDLDLQMGTYFVNVLSESAFKPARIVVN